MLEEGKETPFLSAFPLGSALDTFYPLPPSSYTVLHGSKQAVAEDALGYMPLRRKRRRLMEGGTQDQRRYFIKTS